jgi:ABC transport system ATP-binding/permease protein
MAILLNCDSLTKSFGPRLLFKDISISFAEGERIGLIGPNGSGKSTLMKIMAGAEQADSGEITTKRNLRLAYLPQQDGFAEGATVEQVMHEAMGPLHLEEHERYARMGMLLGKIGFEDFSQGVEQLSGGWRKRLAIARELVKEPELLILDEPTNHLDMEGIVWLERLLAGAPFAFIVVSHDRYFLESTTNRMVELSRQYPLGYLSINGAYSHFLEKREEFLVAQAAEEQALASRVRREIEWLKRGAKARTTKAKGRIEHAAQMMAELAELKVRNTQQQNAEMDFTATDRRTRKLCVAQGVSKTLGGKAIVKDLDLVLHPNMRLGLVGPNGSGKTTVIRMLSGELPPDAGRVKWAEGLRIVRFDQSREQLDRSLTLRQALLMSRGADTIVYQGQAMHVSGWARRFLFRTEQLDQPVSSLSGGEQSRVLIARLMLQPADLLILDEPTNDLDIGTLEVLEESLEEFPGALVLVTHDRYMLESLSTDLLGLDGKGGHGLYGDLAQYERAVEAAWAKPKEEGKKPAAQQATVARPAGKKLSWNEQRELETIESRVMEAEGELEKYQGLMNDPKVLADRNRLAEVCDKVASAQTLVQTLYARWQELESKKA